MSVDAVATDLERFGTGIRHATGPTIDDAMSWVDKAMTAAHGVLIVPDPAAHPNDRFLTSVQVEYLTAADAVYYVARRPGATTRRVWREATFAAGQLGFVTTAGLPSTDIDERDLEAAAEQARLLVVEAYDGEGFIFFERARE